MRQLMRLLRRTVHSDQRVAQCRRMKIRSGQLTNDRIFRPTQVQSDLNVQNGQQAQRNGKEQQRAQFERVSNRTFQSAKGHFGSGGHGVGRIVRNGFVSNSELKRQRKCANRTGQPNDEDQLDDSLQVRHGVSAKGVTNGHIPIWTRKKRKKIINLQKIGKNAISKSIGGGSRRGFKAQYRSIVNAVMVSTEAFELASDEKPRKTQNSSPNTYG